MMAIGLTVRSLAEQVHSLDEHRRKNFGERRRKRSEQPFARIRNRQGTLRQEPARHSLSPGRTRYFSSSVWSQFPRVDPTNRISGGTSAVNGSAHWRR